MEEKLNEKSKLVQTEEKILDFWNTHGIFKKSVEKEAPQGDFVFYDGPPFATGEPHYGHMVPGTIKDVIPRFKTMQGFRVRRRWGWDCHGLPVENIIEKELNFQSKKEIIDYGIGKFNAKAKAVVMRYADDWRKIIPRIGRWVDMDDDYRTMDSSYTESVWWAFAELHKKGLIYEGYKVMQLCPRCETTLSNFEVSQGYKDITDLSVIAEFELVDSPGTFLLAWTTTPWTLPGNAALAINPSIKYVKIEAEGKKFILAESRLAVVKKEYKLLEEVPTKDILGKSYKPPFDYYVKQGNKIKNNQNGWKVYPAEFVTTEDGTGIVHIAPAFGADDYELAQKFSVPVIHHVTMNGLFKSEVTDFAGQHVKAKDTAEDKAKKVETHQLGDVEIIKNLAQKNLLFSKEKLIHSYPHCWRCDTPLLNYATSSWFVKVTDIRDKLVKENKKISWVPKEVGEGRFGNWLLGARDWAISRSRFWGAPLPVWKDEKTGEIVVIGALTDLKQHAKAQNTYYGVRHGESENNVLSIMNSSPENPFHVTVKGKQQIQEAVKWLKDKKIDLVIASPFVRTKETAELIAKGLELSPEKVLIEKQVSELNVGVWNGKSFKDFQKQWAHADRFEVKLEGGENYADLKRRMGNFLYDLEKKYSGKDGGKNILIVSHDSPLFLLASAAKGLTRVDSLKLRGEHDHFIENAKPFALDFSPLPHNEEYELDLHRPFIDEINLVSKAGNKLVRVPEVFDCWFESGSMPFGEAHYPFNKEEFNPKPGPFSKILGKTKGYPADFIAEGLDQTRGWFYSMLVLGVALFGKSPYKSVVVNGNVLAEDGEKMSKRKKNYPDILPTVDKYGADALRYFLMSSPVVYGQDVCFSEKALDEVVKKHIGRLNNVVSFYEMYAPQNLASEPVKSTHPLDLWIMSRLNELGNGVTNCLKAYEISKAARPFADFIDDLSTWYIRRSRDRFKGDNEDHVLSLSTTRTVLLEFSKLIAPFMPFLAEDIYIRLHGPKESVHLEEWPEYPKADEKILALMTEIRRLASLGLEARIKVKINVRQPLAALKIGTKTPAKLLKEEQLISILKDEINVKNIILDPTLTDEVVLDTTLTDELREEGQVREIIRSIQDLRKEAGLVVEDVVTIEVGEDHESSATLKKFKDTIKKTTGLSDIHYISGNVAPHIHNSGIHRI